VGRGRGGRGQLHGRRACGLGHALGYDRAAIADARERIHEFLGRHLRGP
jgi:hypothetical protein